MHAFMTACCPLGGWGQEVPHICSCGSFLLSRPCSSSPWVDFPMKTEWGQFAPLSLGTWPCERQSAPQKPHLTLPCSSACAKLCQKELLVSWKSSSNIYNPFPWNLNWKKVAKIFITHFHETWTGKKQLKYL